MNTIISYTTKQYVLVAANEGDGSVNTFVTNVAAQHPLIMIVTKEPRVV
tara:strand:- start:7202 stop:7348 length:147 start_codon:yes stop_codon:yes gene_type:complete